MALLEVRNVHSGYGKLEILRDITLDVNEGEIVSILGANGAGKTTLLRTISGVLPTWQGTIAFDGQNLKGMRPDKRAQLGLAHQPEGRGIFQTGPRPPARGSRHLPDAHRSREHGTQPRCPPG